MAVLIEATGLEKRFGDIVAVDGISLEVRKGEVLGFLGPNGAGKSTTMKMLTGFLEPDAGSARIAGIDVLEQPKLAKAQARLPARRRALLRRHDGRARSSPSSPRSAASIARRPGAASRRRSRRRELASVLEQRIETLSKGFKRRVAIAQAILHDPQVLIMDEPTDGLDPNQKHQVRKLIAEMAADKAIIVSTHILEEVEAVCSRAVIINRGPHRRRRHGRGPDAAPALSQRHRAQVSRPARAEAVTKALAEFAAIAKVETSARPTGGCSCAPCRRKGAPASLPSWPR